MMHRRGRPMCLPWRWAHTQVRPYPVSPLPLGEGPGVRAVIPTFSHQRGRRINTTGYRPTRPQGSSDTGQFLLHRGNYGQHRAFTGQAAVIPPLCAAPDLIKVTQSLGVETAWKMVADSNPQCIMQLAHLGSRPTP